MMARDSKRKERMGLEDRKKKGKALFLTRCGFLI
jgi:hypothetical protein